MLIYVTVWAVPIHYSVMKAVWLSQCCCPAESSADRSDDITMDSEQTLHKVDHCLPGSDMALRLITFLQTRVNA